jgi:geranylgeranyl reductase family protein
VEEINSDIVIVGAGPAGATMALMLAGSGISVTVIDKERFPRGKICGDALSGKAVSVMRRMPDGIFEAFLGTVPKTPSYGIRFVSPGRHILDVPFKPTGDIPPGFICPRKEFDAFLVSKIRDYDIRLIEGERVVEVTRGNGLATAVTENLTVNGKVIAGADGVHSAVRSLLGQPKPLRKGICTGVRAYFEGVSGLHPENYIELIYLRELLPFYFWIFPEVNGLCNAGLAMLQSEISSNRVNVGAVFDQVIKSHPTIAPRFRGARMAGRAEAHALPLGTQPGPLSGDRFLLLGDAASLVDPFTGEGIGNAMASGEVAARVIKNCFEKGDLSANGLGNYEVQLRRRIGRDLRISGMLQKLAKSPRLFDLVSWTGRGWLRFP